MLTVAGQLVGGHRCDLGGIRIVAMYRIACCSVAGVCRRDGFDLYSRRTGMTEGSRK